MPQRPSIDPPRVIEHWRGRLKVSHTLFLLLSTGSGLMAALVFFAMIGNHVLGGVEGTFPEGIGERGALIMGWALPIFLVSTLVLIWLDGDNRERSFLGEHEPKAAP